MTATTTIPNNISNQAQECLEQSRFMNNPYFRDLADGRMSLQQFRESQAQFYHAVKYFARPMSLIIARIPDPHARLTILHNIVEEHGEFEPAHFHEATFRQFLRSLGDDSMAAPGPAVDAFNCLLAGVCGQENLTTAICCIGMIEHAFAGASALIGKSVVERAWVRNSELVHYKLHAEIDIRHAAEFFEIVEADPHHDVADVERGLGLGIYAFDRLYRDLV
jgi:pyrroloquinoline-quinone synthase